MPEDVKLEETHEQSMPYFLYGDETFPLKTQLMKQFHRRNANEAERAFNYRHLRRARCIIENACGILSARWRIFHKSIRATVCNVEKYTLACLALHNYLLLTYDAKYSPVGFIDSEVSCGNILSSRDGYRGLGGHGSRN